VIFTFYFNRFRVGSGRVGSGKFDRRATRKLTVDCNSVTASLHNSAVQ